MDFLNDIKEKTILVCPFSVKGKVLDYLNKINHLINVKIFSLDEIKENVLFDYDLDAILYLMDKYHFSYEVSKNYIENMYYIEDKKYNNSKIDFLVNLKKELIDNNHLIKNNLFIDSYKNTPFIVFGYDYLSSFDKKVLSNFNYKVISKKEYLNKINAFEFKTLEDEVLFVANKIIELINKGVDINKIYLLNLDSDYKKVIERIFNMFNIPVNISHSSNVLSTILGKNAFSFLEKSKSFEETLEYIKKFKNYSAVYDKFLNVFNDYSSFDYPFEIIFSAIKYELMNICILDDELSNMVRVGNLYNSIYDENDYVFLLGVNQGCIPRVFKDEDYFGEDVKPLLGIDSVNTINKLELDSTICNIKSIKNLFVTYKRNYLDSVFYPANLLDNEMFIIEKKFDISTCFSNRYSNIFLSFMLDDLIKYEKKSEFLSKYFNSLKIPFMEYDNRYKKISKNKLFKLLDNKLILSYTSINTFYKCKFRYYVENILKLNKYEETFDTFIGSLFHFVLSHLYDENFDIDKEYDFYLKDKEFSNKEKFYLSKLKKELRIICERLKEFQNDTEFTNVFTEKNIKIDKSTDIEVIFKGIVDKIMYKEYDGRTLISIIDYKTGEADIDIFNSKYGIDMQLIIYLYLITKSNLFKNYSCVGFYLQKILSNEVNIEIGKSYLDIKNDNLKLIGYSTDNVLDLEKFDPTYENSNYIKSMKTTKSGFGYYSKVLDEETMKNLSLLVDDKINEARDSILLCDFAIDPKWISDDKEITGCKYCKYIDICYRKNEDIVNLKKYKDLSFLKEGDDNA